MKRYLYVTVLLGLAGSLAFLQTRAVGQTAGAANALKGGPDEHRQMLTSYCSGCHNSRVKAGGLAMDVLNLDNATGDAAIWEKAMRKLRGHLMPPPGSPQPAQAKIDAFSTWMEATLDANTKGPKAGYVPVQRLNRTEYATSVKELLGVDVNEKEILPNDIQVEGFDNIAEALTTSPAFLDQYLDAARRTAKKAVGDMHPPISSWYIKTGGNQDPEMPFPPGVRGAMTFVHNFPADGEYRFSMAFDERSIGLYNAGLQNRTTQVLLVDGKVVFKGDIGGDEDLRLANVKGTDGWAKILERFQKIPVKVEAGPHNVTLGFIERSHVESDDNVGGGGFGGRGGAGAPMANLADSKNNALEIKGPYNPTGISHSTTRPMIFVCDPKAIGEEACARRIADHLAHRAYRRPLTKDDLDHLMKFYAEGRLDNGTFDQGVTEIVAAVLASPDFLFRSIRGSKAAASVAKAAEFPLSDLELASRLSFFLWSTGPDAELLKIAEANGLSKPGVVDAQVKRMLADPKAQSLVSSFAMKWLNLNSLDSVVPDPKVFRGFDPTLRSDFQQEARLFVANILLGNHSVVDLLTSDQTFVNNRLARHYGIQGPSTSAFKQVTLSDETRFGLLGKAGVLMRTSYGDRTSPVLRGAWVLDKLIGTPPTPPPPNVDTDLSQKPGQAPKTVRARLELHRDKTACKQCHGVIDPTGLALENFDSIGTWRTFDPEAQTNIDTATVLPSGVPINGVAELRKELASHPENFARALTEKLLMYSVNRPLEYYDMPQVRKIVRDAKKDNYTLNSLVMGIVRSDAFRKQGVANLSKAPGKAETVAAKAAPVKPAAAKATPVKSAATAKAKSAAQAAAKQ